MRSRDRIAVGWIDPGTVDGVFATSMMTVYAERQNVIKSILRVEGSGLLSRSRNQLVAAFMNDTDFEWLLMIDSDEQLSIEAFDLLAGAVHDTERPIMSGLVFGAWPSDDLYPTPIPAILKTHGSRYLPIHDYPANAVIQVDAAGTGCLMVHRSVFQAIRDTASIHEGPDWCWFHDMPINGEWFSEDLFFSRRAISAGFPIHAHTGATLPHRKQYWLTEDHHRKARA